MSRPKKEKAAFLVHGAHSGSNCLRFRGPQMGGSPDLTALNGGISRSLGDDAVRLPQVAAGAGSLG